VFVHQVCYCCPDPELLVRWFVAYRWDKWSLQSCVLDNEVLVFLLPHTVDYEDKVGDVWLPFGEVCLGLEASPENRLVTCPGPAM